MPPKVKEFLKFNLIKTLWQFCGFAAALLESQEKPTSKLALNEGKPI